MAINVIQFLIWSKNLDRYKTFWYLWKEKAQTISFICSRIANTVHVQLQLFQICLRLVYFNTSTSVARGKLLSHEADSCVFVCLFILANSFLPCLKSPSPSSSVVVVMIGSKPRRGIILTRALSDCSAENSRRNSRDDQFDDERLFANRPSPSQRHTIGKW